MWEVRLSRFHKISFGKHPFSQNVPCGSVCSIHIAAMRISFAIMGANEGAAVIVHLRSRWPYCTFLVTPGRYCTPLRGTTRGYTCSCILCTCSILWQFTWTHTWWCTAYMVVVVPICGCICGDTYTWFSPQNTFGNKKWCYWWLALLFTTGEFCTLYIPIS